jgi:hypothetical protein
MTPAPTHPTYDLTHHTDSAVGSQTHTATEGRPS